jgi:hypothetical protein
MFNTQQEMDLGDAVAEQFQREYRVIDDPAVAEYLQRVGDRLVQHLPASSTKYQFVLSDLPFANAFGTTGGRVYVTRKLVGFLRTEDELAGLLGHELGHMVAHQFAIDMSERFQKLLGVNSVSDRRDIFEKYNQLLDSRKRKPDLSASIARREEPSQLVADRLGLYAASASGYDPRGFVQFWDRFADTKGKTGGFFSDVFGTTKPEERRLREMGNEIASLPGTCGESRPPASSAEFGSWKTSVMNYSGLGHRESLHGVVFKQELNPPLRGDIRFLRFSPDGKYVLAQDDSSIYILSREAFAPLFRMDAPEAFPAMFSADSQTVSFYTPSLRVETWNLADQQRTELHDMVVLKGCRQTVLSPDGKFLACYNGALDLLVYDLASGQPVLERKSFYEPRTFREFLSLYLGQLQDDVLSRILTMRFSPDGHYFVASSHNETTVALDLTTQKTFALRDSIRKLLSREFVFIGPDRIVGIDTFDPKKSAIVRFPGGETLEEFPLGAQNLEAAAHGNYLMLRPIDKYAMGVMDLETKKIFMADKESAFDIFDIVAVVERLDGEIALKQISNNQQIAKVNLPRSPLAPLWATAISPDMKWLAVSERSRGGVWDLTKNERPFYVRGFTGAYFDADGTLYADFPKFQETGRAVAQLNLAAKTVTPAFKLEDEAAHQYGPIILVTKPNGKDGRLGENVTLGVRDSVTGKSMWTRQFPKEAPRVFVAADSSTLTFLWRLSTGTASLELKSDDDLAKRASPVKHDETNFLVEIVDAHSGKSKGGLAVDTNKGAFDIRDLFAVGDRVVISDSLNRVLVYSAASGEQTGKAFGRSAESCGGSGLIVAENEAGQLLFYDLSTMEKRDELQFNSPIAMKRFSDDGKRLFVLTAAQTAYVFDVAALPKSATPTANASN